MTKAVIGQKFILPERGVVTPLLKRILVPTDRDSTAFTMQHAG